ncbi:aldehyde dehydrogenase family protein [Phytohabitans kaempferiae]|uniref:Aldehyde dehydrogenase family protein n=1 Tax=Phytohabitans kaempferiae TaxID=1620943 RepID=A0ABV6M592_9ACTN
MAVSAWRGACRRAWWGCADRIPAGIAHINDQTVNDEANVPCGGIGSSGTGARFGGAAANVEAFTETRWVTVRGDVPRYPF